ncbi:hypothetical protein CYMTET_14000 [Cymbomonas tetramitiformis]|uniref:Uncharacterized protein n=1 Tax=Cymbomonas tetramitiformis TaxID=36881 RepID=A0AAE0GHI2_9CHLO|nr:hypothetical protein CYMTET_14000 [Cymbomonas tetramitiformis]
MTEHYTSQDQTEELKVETTVAGKVEASSKYHGRHRICNFVTESQETWSVKSENFQENYGIASEDGSELTLSDEMLEGDPVVLQDFLQNVLKARNSKKLNELGSSVDWGRLQQVLLDQKKKLSPQGQWRVAFSQGMVIGIELTPELLKETLEANLIPYDGREELFREETFHPAYSFKPGDFLASDVASAQDQPSSTAITPARRWVWKRTNKVVNGQTLITRTVERASFLATYELFEPDVSGA